MGAWRGQRRRVERGRLRANDRDVVNEAMNYRFGYRDVEYPCESLGELRSSNDLLEDVGALHERMQADGYLLLRAMKQRARMTRFAILSSDGLNSSTGLR